MAQPVKPILDPRENAYGYGKTPKANSGGFYREVGKNIANAFTGKKDPNGFDIRTRMQYNNYITNFVKDAIDAISIALQTGIINPNATEPTATATQTVPQQPTATATQTVPQKKQTAQPTSDYINKIAAAMNGTADQRKKIALAKNLINYMSSRKGTTD